MPEQPDHQSDAPGDPVAPDRTDAPGATTGSTSGPGTEPGTEPETEPETDAERRRRRARFLRELAEARELRDRVQPRRAKVARLRQTLRMRTFRW
ncbi:hypothetical protein ACWD5R_17385 [Streptomyces sp. NPDC002514]|uniref:hypothetical protein n=1 Tax=Streptomyces sp. NPDC001270 TaxID=3364554 RepID=UPI0036A902EE